MNNYVYLSDKIFLEKLEKYPIKKKFIKVILLDFSETNVLCLLQGKMLSGSINKDGSSAIRRTANFTLALEETDLDLQNIDNYISMNKKFLLEVGYYNDVDDSYPEIVWFPQGLYVISSANSAHDLASINISITAKDKMCLLNGEAGGVLPAMVTFHERYAYTYDKEGNITGTEVTYPTIYQIVQEAVNHLGGEDLNKIIIDIPLQARMLMEYRGSMPIYFETQGGVFTGNYSFNKIYSEYQEYNYGDCIGYKSTDFTYPGELILSAGDTVTAVLDKVVEVLGNYEYFYDEYGYFHFQEMKNYMINPYESSLLSLNEESYYSDFSESKEVYNFNEANLQTAFTLNPNYENIKNDFIVWGTKKSNDIEIAVRYHLAIDDKPVLSEGITDWREELYQQGKASEKNNIESNYYWTELAAEWRGLYDPNNADYNATNHWNPDVIYNPSNLKFYLDFIPTGSEVGKFSVNSIGRRTKVVNDNAISSIYSREIPDIIFIESKEEEEKMQLRGQAYSFIDDFLDSLIVVSSQSKTAFDVIRNLLYQHTFYNDTISITAIPNYKLEPNTRVTVDYSPANIHGSYIVKNISLPLNYNGLMTVTLSKALEKI